MVGAVVASVGGLVGGMVTGLVSLAHAASNSTHTNPNKMLMNLLISNPPRNSYYLSLDVIFTPNKKSRFTANPISL